MSNKLLTLGAVAAAALMTVPTAASASPVSSSSSIEMDDYGRPTIGGQSFETMAAVAPTKPTGPVQNGNCPCSNSICW